MMKLRESLRYFLLASGGLLAAATLHAADGTWDVDADGSWNTDTNWLGNATSAITPAGNTFSITWAKSGGYSGNYNTDFVVETSDTLVGPWTTPNINVTIIGNNVTYTFPLPLGAKTFARLKVTGP